MTSEPLAQPIIPVPLKQAQCHVWSVSLDFGSDALAPLLPLLSTEERQRADAFLLPAPRKQFIFARAALRTVLARYLGSPPEACRFETNRWGKPSLSPASDLRFNLSHAGDQALIAVARGFDIGVDIERHRPLEDIAAMARMVMCAHEFSFWAALPIAEQTTSFYRVWTCKEAVSKAIGRGLSVDFPGLQVELLPGRAARLVGMDACWGRADQWSLIEMDAPQGYSAALAAASPGLRESAAS
jgi:4'-phosphopantetheinyl transferase